jgi:transcriptional regulator with XRE-family HTH domain
MGQLVIAPSPPGCFGALLRACRHRACLSQEQLAARAGVSERTVRTLRPAGCARRTPTLGGCWLTRCS